MHDKKWLNVLKAAAPKGKCSKTKLESTSVLYSAGNPTAANTGVCNML